MSNRITSKLSTWMPQKFRRRSSGGAKPSADARSTPQTTADAVQPQLRRRFNFSADGWLRGKRPAKNGPQPGAADAVVEQQLQQARALLLARRANFQDPGGLSADAAFSLVAQALEAAVSAERTRGAASPGAESQDSSLLPTDTVLVSDLRQVTRVGARVGLAAELLALPRGMQVLEELVPDLIPDAIRDNAELVDNFRIALRVKVRAAHALAQLPQDAGASRGYLQSALRAAQNDLDFGASFAVSAAQREAFDGVRKGDTRMPKSEQSKLVVRPRKRAKDFLLQLNNPLQVTLHNPFTQTVRNTGTTAPTQARKTVEQQQEKIQKKRVSTKPLGKIQSGLIDKITRHQIEFVAPRSYPAQAQSHPEPDLVTHQIQTCFLSALEQRVHRGNIHALNEALIGFAKTQSGASKEQYRSSLQLIHRLLIKHRGNADAALTELQTYSDSDSASSQPQTTDFIQALHKRFEGGDFSALNKALLEFTSTLPDAPGDNKAMGIRLASNLSKAADKNADHALLMLRALRTPPQERSASTEPDANKLRHALAESGSGMTILLHLENKKKLTNLQKQAYRHSLDICRRLTRLIQPMPSFRPDGKTPWTGSISDFVCLAKAHGKIDDAILQPGDHPTQLLSKALLFAVEKMAHGAFEAISVRSREAHFGAYHAYSNGYYSSLPGSPLFEYVEQISRWRKHRKRAGEHGPATAENLRKDFRKGVRKTLTGQGQEPIKAMVEQMLTILGTDQEEGEKFRAQLHSTIDALHTAMQRKLRKMNRHPEFYNRHEDEKIRLQVRMALLGMMREKGIKGFRIEKAALLAKLAANGLTPATDAGLLACIDHELSLHPLHKVLVDQELSGQGWYARSTRVNEVLGKKLLPEARRMRFKMLEQYAQDLFKPPAEISNGMRVQFQERITELRAIPRAERTRPQRKELEYARLMLGSSQARQLGNGGQLQKKDRINNFQMRDLAVLAKGKRPRARINPGLIDETLEQVGTLRPPQMNTTVTYSSSTRARGVNLGQVDIGLPGILTGRMILAFNRSRKSLFQAGNAPAGVEWVGGKSKAWNLALGARMTVGWNAANKQTGLYAAGGFEAGGTFRHKGTHAVVSSALDMKGPGYQTAANKDHLHYSKEIAGLFKNLSAGEHAPSHAEIWQRLSLRTGDDQRMNFALRKTKEWNSTVGIHGGLGARAGAAGFRVGPYLGLDALPSAEHIEIRNNGRFRNTTINEQVSLRLRFSASFVAKLQTQAQHDSVKFGLTGLPIWAVSRDLDLLSFRSMIRIGSDENGVRNGQTFRTRYFQNSDDMVRYLNSREANHLIPDWASDYKMKTQDGRTVTGKALIEEMKREMAAEGKTGNVKFEERVQLGKAAAAQIRFMTDEIMDLFSTGPRGDRYLPHPDSCEAKEIQALEQKIIDIYSDDRSWIDRWLKVTQMEYKAKTKFIPLVPVVTTSQEHAETWHARIDARGTEARVKTEVPYTGVGAEYQRALDERVQKRDLIDDIADYASDVTESDGEGGDGR
jgi:hypothetical protein